MGTHIFDVRFYSCPYLYQVSITVAILFFEHVKLISILVSPYLMLHLPKFLLPDFPMAETLTFIAPWSGLFLPTNTLHYQLSSIILLLALHRIYKCLERDHSFIHLLILQYYVFSCLNVRSLCLRSNLIMLVFLCRELPVI